MTTTTLLKYEPTLSPAGAGYKFTFAAGEPPLTLIGATDAVARNNRLNLEAAAKTLRRFLLVEQALRGDAALSTPPASQSPRTVAFDRQTSTFKFS